MLTHDERLLISAALRRLLAETEYDSTDREKRDGSWFTDDEITRLHNRIDP